MNEAIDFYMEVEVVEPRSVYVGRRGGVLGISREEDGVVKGYAVMLHGMDTSVFFESGDVVATGVRFDRSHYY
ncbi:hypothetical protein [Stenotrophomonas maltophilia]|uniref:hypothetical protein n=1 Tax=Stenotrophomonas TaxID=40323 RepID=UPI000A53AEF0|nr:hypothetical protein [Stenotrophomonas maltophilia]MBY6279794.1 hypothetical protein [Stenotrophomonas maltophilia]MCF3519220.1 hypothetical protein [Stenotrophomonas maltophilia]PSD31906.1 hypothetical protein C7E12_01760 [Stenotrophomonas maltophilia]